MDLNDERIIGADFISDEALLTAIYVMLMGDYNGNGVVDAADYNVWRDTFNSDTNLAADGNRNGIIDAADYNIWRDNFGNTVGAVVPESTSVALLIAGAFWLVIRSNRVARSAV